MNCSVHPTTTKQRSAIAHCAQCAVHNVHASPTPQPPQVPDVAEAMDLGLKAATLISQKFPPPVKLEFEKVLRLELALPGGRGGWQYLPVSLCGRSGCHCQAHTTHGTCQQAASCLSYTASHRQGSTIVMLVAQLIH
jgi:hypothetical protein